MRRAEIGEMHFAARPEHAANLSEGDSFFAGGEVMEDQRRENPVEALVGERQGCCRSERKVDRQTASPDLSLRPTKNARIGIDADEVRRWMLLSGEHQ